MEDNSTHIATYNSLWQTTDEETVLNTTQVSPTDISKVNLTTANSSISKFYPIIVAEMLCSVICLILTIIVYSILPEFKNVHGKNLISLSACLLTTFTLLCFDIILRLHISYSFCFTIAVIIHVTFLATFFWTNVMAFDIWNNMTSMKAKSEIKGQSKKYFNYSVYAWTATILTALPAVILESTDLVPPMYRPQFGVKRCWLSGKTAFIYYFNLPVGVILFGNLIMFILTIWKLWKIKKATSSVLHVKQQQQRLNLYLKLFFVMGIIWIAEFLPWATKIYKLYALAGMLTSLHGVLLFIIFVMKKRIIKQVLEKIRGTSDTKSVSTSLQTSSSNEMPKTFQSYADSKA